MYNIAIVEDERSAQDTLKEFLNKAETELSQQFSVNCYESIELFDTPMQQKFDIVFFDIELPGVDGMNGAIRFREKNPDAIIIFTTNLRQFVLKGYEVEALDYMVKPISYDNFLLKMKKAVNKLSKMSGKVLLVRKKNDFVKIDTRDLLYVEIFGHILEYHTFDGVYNATGNLSNLETELEGNSFFRCHSCFLVNMRNIAEIRGDEAILTNGEKIQISRRKKKEFFEEFTRYFSSN